MAEAYLGIEIGGTKLQVVLGDGRGHIERRERFQVVAAEGGEGIRNRLREVLPVLTSAHAPVAVGVGFGGPVDWRSGTIRCSHQIAGWADYPLGDWLAEVTGLPVRVENDANVAAFGEAGAGAGRGFRTVFYVTLGSGVGGGLAVDGGIYHGAAPGEVEIGHVRLDRSGATVESRCSGWAVDRRLRQLVEEHPAGMLAQLAGDRPGGEARHLEKALTAGDTAAEGLLAEVTGDLAFGLSHVVHLLHPEVIVVGGGLSLLGEPLRAAVACALEPLIMDAFRPGPAVRLAGLGEDAVPTGALLLAATLPLAPANHRCD